MMTSAEVVYYGNLISELEERVRIVALRNDALNDALGDAKKQLKVIKGRLEIADGQNEELANQLKEIVRDKETAWLMAAQKDSGMFENISRDLNEAMLDLDKIKRKLDHVNNIAYRRSKS